MQVSTNTRNVQMFIAEAWLLTDVFNLFGNNNVSKGCWLILSEK